MEETIFICPPKFYNISYEINPWMKKGNETPNDFVYKQWNNLCEVLRKNNVSLKEIDPQDGCPDMVFTANAGLVAHNNVILSNFKYEERKREKVFYKEWFKETNFNIIEFSEDVFFEGAGDCLVGPNGFVFMGYGFRTDPKAYNEPIWEELFNLSISSIKIELINPNFYHLDTCLCPLDKNQILLYPKAFNKQTISYLSRNFDVLPVKDQDAYNFACNAILINNKNIIIPSGCEETKEMLQQNEYIVHEVNMSEFIKSGGACKCLTLRI